MRRGIAPVTCTVALALAGCGHDVGDLDQPDSPVATNSWDGGAGQEALLEGTLDLQGGCLVVISVWEPHEPIVPAFPRAYTAWDAEREVLTYAGTEFAMGDAISAAGGGGPVGDGTHMPAACTPGVEGWLFHIMDDEIVPN